MDDAMNHMHNNIREAFSLSFPGTFIILSTFDAGEPPAFSAT
jgi:hypothetical protein